MSLLHYRAVATIKARGQLPPPICIASPTKLLGNLNNENISINESVETLRNLRNFVKFRKLCPRTPFYLLIIESYFDLKSTKSNLALPRPSF